MTAPTKYCKRCDHDLPESMFGLRKKRDGSATLATYCLWCEADRHREWVANNPGKTAQYQKRWRERRRDGHVGSAEE